MSRLIKILITILVFFICFSIWREWQLKQKIDDYKHQLFVIDSTYNMRQKQHDSLFKAREEKYKDMRDSLLLKIGTKE